MPVKTRSCWRLLELQQLMLMGKWFNHGVDLVRACTCNCFQLFHLKCLKSGWMLLNLYLTSSCFSFLCRNVRIPKHSGILQWNPVNRFPSDCKLKCYRCLGSDSKQMQQSHLSPSTYGNKKNLSGISSGFM